MTDALHRFLFESHPVRGEFATLDGLWQTVLERRDYPAPVRRVLGAFHAAKQRVHAVDEVMVPSALMVALPTPFDTARIASPAVAEMVLAVVVMSGLSEVVTVAMP